MTLNLRVGEIQHPQILRKKRGIKKTRMNSNAEGNNMMINSSKRHQALEGGL